MNSGTAIDADRKEILDLCRAYFKRHKQVPPFVAGETYVPASGKVMDEDDLSQLVDSSLDMWLTAGRFAKEFEERIPAYFERKRVKGLLVNSGSSANLIAISSLGSPMLENFGLKALQAGDEVITVAAGFPTTVNPILQNGWVPVFVDVDHSTLNALPEVIMAAKTPKTRAVVLAHTLGNPYRSDVLAKWCAENNLYLVEDCCDALGAKIGDRAVGSFGDFATLSFYPAHHITMGEGGVVVAKDVKLTRVAESLRDWGRDCWCDPGQDNTCKKRFNWQLGTLPQGYDHKYTYSSIGYNLKVTDMQAAVGLSQLDKAEGFIAKRRENWTKIYTGIASSPLLSEHLQPVEATEGTSPSWFGFPIHCRPHLNRNQLTQFLESRKVGTRLVFAGNLIRQPAYKSANYRVHGELKNTDAIMTNTFWIGVHPGIDDQRISYILEQLEAGVKKVLGL